jgi:hypothetical protein
MKPTPSQRYGYRCDCWRINLSRDKEIQNARVKTLIVTKHCLLSSFVRRTLYRCVRMYSWLIKQYKIVWNDINIFKATNSTVDFSWTLTFEDKDPCGGGVEYLHRDPASRRRRRKGKPQLWDSKIWSQVPRDSHPTKTALARASSIYKRQTRPLVREGAPQVQDRNCHASNKDLVVSPRWCFVPRQTGRLTVGCNIRLRLCRFLSCIKKRRAKKYQTAFQTFGFIY